MFSAASNFAFPPSLSLDRPMVIQQAPRVSEVLPMDEENNIFTNGGSTAAAAAAAAGSQDCTSWDFALSAAVEGSGAFLSSFINSSIIKSEIENWKNTFHMRPFNLSNFPSGQATYRTTNRSQSIAMQRARMGYTSSAAKSLELLRQNLQKHINKEIDEILRKYLEKFLKPGIDNIRRNNGEHSVTDDQVHTVCRQMLEEAKKMYSTASTRGSTPSGDCSDSETGSQSELRFGRPFTRSPLMRKRKDSDTDSEASQAMVKPVKKKGRPPLHLSGGLSGRSTPSKQGKNGEPVKREGPKWNPQRLMRETIFVMGAKANKALGFGQTRGRLYTKHPDLFKYCGDSDDKQWLYENSLMPVTGGKAYMLILDDIKELADSEEYRNSPGLLLDELIGFQVPQQMMDKMRVFMNSMRTDLPAGAIKQYRGRPLTTLEPSVPDQSHNNAAKPNVILSQMPDFMGPVIKRDLESSGGASPTDDLDEVLMGHHSHVLASLTGDLREEPPMSAPFDISVSNSP